MRTLGAHRVGRWVALLAAVLLVAVPTPVASAASKPPDPTQQRQAVRAKRAAVATKVNVLRSTNKELTAALDALDTNVAEAQSDYSTARAAASSATTTASDAHAAEVAKQAALDAERAGLRDVAVRAYTDSADDSGGGVASIVDDSGDTLLRSGYAQISAANLALVLDQLRQRAQDLATAREAADAAQADAAQHKADESLRLNEVRQRQSEQQSLAAKTRAHLDAALAESSALANLDATLSSQIAAADAALRRRVASASGGSGGGGATVGENGTAVASGIRVAASIASAVNRLMAASARAGLSLDGGGWRNPSEQIALREAHCGSSHYAIYEAPSDSCHPPTAPPGSSMHERGLAIDFTCNGALIVSRSNPCYRWLARNAGRYGLQNLPSEPWHWSTNGD